MPATLDLNLTMHLAESFPNEGWQTIFAKSFFIERNGRVVSDWSSTKSLVKVGGVYAILLPTAWFFTPRTLHLHAPHRFKGIGIPFEFTLPDFTGDGFGVVYAGKTANLGHRWRGHLGRGKRKDGCQVKYGLVDCQVAPDLELALKQLRENARIIYTVLDGPDQCANRDVLEMSLCARFGPPFNIKSER
jgi:hypothetical protein